MSLFFESIISEIRYVSHSRCDKFEKKLISLAFHAFPWYSPCVPHDRQREFVTILTIIKTKETIA